MKMGEALKKVQDQAGEKTSKNTREKVGNTLTDELIIGICAPIGSLKKEVIDAIIERLKEYNYETEIIKLSSFIQKLFNETEINEVGHSKNFSKKIHLINGGDYIRSHFKNNSALVELAISKIYADRIGKEMTRGSTIPFENLEMPKIEDLNSRRKCFIIDSLKNPEELHLLRDIYGEMFYSFSLFSPLHERKENLFNDNLTKDEVERIISIDENESKKSGQNVRDTFVNADFFLRVSKDNLPKLKDKVNRYLHLIFNTQIITPYSDENAMYQAKSAAGNSACLSRQVGAAITDYNGVLLSTGWNDVPKFGGNLYQEGDTQDKRCKMNGICLNDKTKDSVTENIIYTILKDEALKSQLFKDGITQESSEIKSLINHIRSNSKVKDLIEFSRSVHAEMHAIIIGSQLTGIKMINGKLYTTTYPCHNCARHIVVAGIKEVYFIEPYPKSLSLQLHNDSMTEDENQNDKIKILMYDGVAPRRFMELFSKTEERKNNLGDINKKELETATPRVRKSLQSFVTLERQAIISLEECGINPRI